MTAVVIQFRPKSAGKTVRPVFPSISGSLTIKSMDDIPLTGCAYGLIMGQAGGSPCDLPHGWPDFQHSIQKDPA